MNGMSNLPPGCSVSDIPGNRPEDEENEKFWEAFSQEAPELDISGRISDLEDLFIKSVETGRNIGYNKGWLDSKQAYEADQAETRYVSGRCTCTWVRNHKGVDPDIVVKDLNCPVHGRELEL